MISWEAAFSLGFSPINIVISLVFISLAIWLIKVNLPTIDLALAAKLKSSLNRVFEGSGKQPLYSVFYNLHHSSTEAWVNWIKTQKEKQQERAFRRLSEYLDEPPKELGLITKEVVKAVALFEHKESYEVLENLLKNSREDWGKFKTLNSFYEDAASNLVSLDPNQAEKFLTKELRLAKNFKETDELKISILNALSTLPNPDRVSFILTDTALDSNQSKYIRLESIKRIETLGEQIHFDILKTVLNTMLKEKNPDDKEIFKYCFNSLLDLAKFDNGDDSIDEKWNIINQACLNELFGEYAIDALSERINDKTYLLNSKAVFKLIQDSSNSNTKVLIKILENRYQISEDEKEIFNNSENLVKLNQYQQSCNEIINIEIHKKESIEIPKFLEDEYINIENLLKNPSNKIKLITGESKDEKYFFMKAFAIKNSRNLIVVDVEKLLLSPDKFTELDSIIQEHKPCIIYLTDVASMLTPNEQERKRADKLFNQIRKIFIDSRINIVGCINHDSVTIRDNYPEIHGKIAAIPNIDFAAKVNLGALSAKQKQKIYNHFELKLKDEREIGLESIEEVLNVTEGFSNIKYLNYLLQYMKNSLLSHGKLISIDSYQKLLNEQTKELAA